MSATARKLRLRADLQAAMQAKASDEVRMLRTLIAALDNAEAVAEARLAAADEDDRHQQHAEAARLRHEADLIARYR